MSEEKESRMIEIILSSVTSKELIRGKLIGLLGVVLTQTALLLLLGILSLMIFDLSLPINFSEIPIQPETVIISTITILLAFIILANVMIGVGSAVPTLKEAQGLSTIFVMASVIPFYFVTLILAQPDSTFSVVVSHLPLTGPITFLFRNVVYSVPPLELVTIHLSLIAQVIVSNYAAFKLFELGALQFQNPIKLSWLFRR
jgi:ABC-2 type transport system permease protein